MFSSSSLLSEKQNPQQPLKFFKWTFLCFCTRFPMWKCHRYVCCSWRVFGAALACSGLSDWSWLWWWSRQFSEKTQNQFICCFLKHLLLSFGTTLSAGLQAKIRFGNSLVLAFLQAGVTVEAVASWNWVLTTEGVYCWCSMSLANWKCKGRNKGDQCSLGFYV